VNAGSPWAERALLVALALAALGLFLGTPALIVPWRAELPWYESAAFFPRLGLMIMALGAVAEMLVRVRSGQRFQSEELDSATAQLPKAAASVLLFSLYALAVPVLGFGTSTALFLLACGRLVGLSWRATVGLALPLAALLWLVFVQGLKVAFGHGWLP
jgi:Tripartite tricarboxylate transporter TctB family